MFGKIFTVKEEQIHRAMIIDQILFVFLFDILGRAETTIRRQVLMPCLNIYSYHHGDHEHSLKKLIEKSDKYLKYA